MRRSLHCSAARHWVRLRLIRRPRPGPRSWPRIPRCLRLLQTNAPSRCSHPRRCDRTALSVYPSTWKQSSTCSSGRACHFHACCVTCVYPSPAPVCAERLFSASSVVGPLFSESTVPTLRRLRRRLTPARTVPQHCLSSPRRRTPDSTQ